MGLVVNATPRPLYPQEVTRCPLCRRLGGPQGWSGRERKISPLPGFYPRTAQTVASCYTDWAIEAPLYELNRENKVERSPATAFEMTVFVIRLQNRTSVDVLRRTAWSYIVSCHSFCELHEIPRTEKLQNSYKGVRNLTLWRLTTLIGVVPHR